MALVMTSAPASEPITVTEAKAHLRIDGAAEDLLVGSLILTSRLHIEAALGLALITQGWKLLLDRWPRGDIIELPLRPLQSVTAVRVVSALGAVTVLDPAAYEVDAASAPPRLVRTGSVWTAPGKVVSGIEVDFIAGYGTASQVPAPLKQALLLLTAHWYEHRDPIEIGSPETAVPAGISELLMPYRRKRL